MSASRFYELAQALDGPLRHFFSAFLAADEAVLHEAIAEDRICHRFLTSCPAGREFN